MRYCSICYGNKLFNYTHISSIEHVNNMRKLPPNFHLMKDADIIKYLRKTGNNPIKLQEDQFAYQL